MQAQHVGMHRVVCNRAMLVLLALSVLVPGKTCGITSRAQLDWLTERVCLGMAQV
jgi:hypothetical protein